MSDNEDNDKRPRVMLDMDAQPVKGRIVSQKPSGTKLIKIMLEDDGSTVVRHVDRVSALNDAARKFLGK